MDHCGAVTLAKSLQRGQDRVLRCARGLAKAPPSSSARITGTQAIPCFNGWCPLRGLGQSFLPAWSIGPSRAGISLRRLASGSGGFRPASAACISLEF